MINLFVNIVYAIARTVAFVVATVFWFVIGLFIWVRLLVISMLLFTAHVSFAPFTRERRVSDAAKHNLDRAIRFWPQGFTTIYQATWGSDSGDGTPDDDGDGFLMQIAKFIWYLFLSVIFWASSLFVLHTTGIWRIKAFEPLEIWKHAEAAAPPVPPPESISPSSQSKCEATGNLIVKSPAVETETNRPVKIRSGPGTSYAKLGELPKGQRVKILSATPDGAWSMVEIDGVTQCFVSSDYLGTQATVTK